MAGCRGLVSLALLCLWLCHDSLANNHLPCQPSKWNNAFDTFQYRHILPGTAGNWNQNKWQKYIRRFGCDRPTQSFLKHGDLTRVKAVCSSQGGMWHKENLCISRQPFSYYTVHSKTGTCMINKIQSETKHLILACDLIQNHCLPVHFQGNRGNLKPNKNNRGCRG